MTITSLTIKNELRCHGLSVGVVVARGIQVFSTPQALHEKLTSLVAKRKEETFPSEALKENVRKLLKSGGFKPTGRNKPASEYLAQAAREDRFPFLNNLVDINNYISLSSGLPVTLLDLDATSEEILIRHGHEGEKYIFNPSGQEIDLSGSIVVCRANPAPGIPLGSPVKDSMEGKIKEHTRSIIGVIYSPTGFILPPILKEYLDEFVRLLQEFGKAENTEADLLA